MSLDDKRRFNAVNDEARSLGYQIVAELNPAARI